MAALLPPKPTSFSYLLNMKLMSLEVQYHHVAMCTKYCSILFHVLTHHTTLQRLIITSGTGCEFDAKECEDLLEMLKTKTSLKYLKIGGGRCVGGKILSDLTAECIAAGLVHNHSLKELDISENNITSVGATSIFRALVSNTTLESLYMSENKLQFTPNSPSLPTSSSNTSSSNSSSSSLSESPESQLLAQPTPALSTRHCQPLSPSHTPHDGGVGAAMADMLSHNSMLTKLDVSCCGLTPQSCVSMFKALKHNSSLKKLIMGSINAHTKKQNRFDQAASEALADMLSCNQSLTKLGIYWCDCQPKALARGLLNNTTLTKVTVLDGEEDSIMAALEDLRREGGHTQQPDPEVARCEQVLYGRYVCDP